MLLDDRASATDQTPVAALRGPAPGAARADFRRDDLGSYVCDIAGCRLITREREVELARRIEERRRDLLGLLAALPRVVDEALRIGEKVAARTLPLRDLLHGGLAEIDGQEDQRRAEVLQAFERLALLHRQCNAQLAARKRRAATATTPERRRATLAKKRAAMCAVLWELRLAADPIQRLLGVARELDADLARAAAPTTSSAAAAELAASLEQRSGMPWRELQAWRRQVEQQARQLDHAKAQLIQANLRLVIKLAQRHRFRGFPVMDLIQEGNIGLMKAVDRFDHRLGFKFSTYATWWISQSMSRAIAEHARVIRLPVHWEEAISRQLRVSRELMQRLGREPTLDELAKALELPVERVATALQISREALSLDAPIGESGKEHLSDIIEDRRANDPHRVVEQDHLSVEVESALAGLSPREQRVLRLRFGLGGGEPLTLEEVGRDYGVTRERIRQIQAVALRKLRRGAGRARLQSHWS